MTDRLDCLLHQALQLPRNDRSMLVAILLDSLTGSNDTSITQEWQAELQRSRAGLRASATAAHPWSEARTRLAKL